jgi:hypothetical protein
MDPLFPALPEDLSALSDAELAATIEEHLGAMRLIRANDADFLGDLTAAVIIEQATAGKAQLAALRAEFEVRATAVENFTEVVGDLTVDVAALEDDDDDGEEPGDGDGDDAVVELSAEADDDDGEEETVVEGDLVVAAAVRMQRPPAPSKERKGRQPADEPQGAVLVAAAGVPDTQPGTELDPESFTRIMLKQARRLGPPKHQAGGTEERYLLASAQYDFPEERKLTSDLDANSRKIRALKNTEGNSLVASGGICAPATNVYSIPQFAVTSRPVRDALPSFNADRGAVNVPVPTTLASAANAITIITEANDALGGTYATKSCLDQTCLSYTETAVTIISHCREYGNLNARSWPESITFENELTMAEHARLAEGYLLDRIKALSINVTSADVYSSIWDLIYAITRTASSIRYILRTGENVRLRALMPAWVPDMLVADVAGNQFDRFITREKAISVLRNAGVEPTFYLDAVTGGTSQAFADESAGAIDDFPDVIQFAVYVEGAFIHVDGGSLELGLVRDSTLNSTNDFQMFGETFENVARLAPAQAARWISATVCPSGELPALTTALSC